MKTRSLGLKGALVFGLAHIIILLPGMFGLMAMSMHDGVYGLIIFILEAPAWLLIEALNISSYDVPFWIVASVMTLFYSGLGFLCGKTIFFFSKKG